jgi:hypothetical protein
MRITTPDWEFLKSVMPDAMEQVVIKDFRQKKGLLVATLLRCDERLLLLRLAAGHPIRAATLRHGTARHCGKDCRSSGARGRFPDHLSGA